MITELHNTGSCLIIGGGCSVDEFEFSLIPSDWNVMAVNRCFVDIDIDYQVFADKYFLKWIDRYPITDDRVLISQLKDDRVDYNFVFDREVGWSRHSGCTALQIAQYIGFDNIYLIGYDYYVSDKIHYYEGKYNTEITKAESKAIVSMLNKWVDDFDRFKWTANITNLNPKSKLKKFKCEELNYVI